MPIFFTINFSASKTANIFFVKKLCILVLAKPAQKKNANVANRGGKMVINLFANNGTTNAGYIDTFIKTGSFDSSANGRR